MPKLGMEPIRRRALIDATISEVGQAGSLDVTVGQIAKRAGMSSGLAHHYFGNKEQMLLAAMRHIQTILRRRVVADLIKAQGPLARIEAIIDANLAAENFEPDIVSAWLTFYVQALNSQQAQRLMQIYARRLRSNLLHSLRDLNLTETAEETAHGIGALIDGVYLRQALDKGAPSRNAAIKLIKCYLMQQIRKDS